MLSVALAALNLLTVQPASDDQAIIELAERLEREARDRAASLSVAPAAPAPAAEPGDPFLTALSEFALAAHQLSRAVETSGGPSDLRCIFRGMSEDAGVRADALFENGTRAAHARTYLEIARLAEQASIIANSEEAAMAAASHQTCAANDA